MSTRNLLLIILFVLLPITANAKDLVLGISSAWTNVTFFDDDRNKWGENIKGLSNSAIGLHHYQPLSSHFPACFNTSAMVGEGIYGFDATLAISGVEKNTVICLVLVLGYFLTPRMASQYLVVSLY